MKKSARIGHQLSAAILALAISGTIVNTAHAALQQDPTNATASQASTSVQPLLMAKADEPAVPNASVAPVPPPAPSSATTFNWKGFYVGATGGKSMGTYETGVNPLPSAATFVNLLPQNIKADTGGITFGGHVGYNWQWDNLVFGGEFDMGSYSGADVTKVVSPIIQNNNTPFPGAGNNITVTHDSSWYGSARPRLGFAVRNLLFYGTAGVSFAHVQGTVNTDFRPVGTEQYPAAYDDTRVSYVVGGGVEVGFHTHWIARGEFLAYPLVNPAINASPVPPLPPFGITYTFLTRVQNARFGVSYKF